MEIKPCPCCGVIPKIACLSGKYFPPVGSKDCVFCAELVFIVRPSEEFAVEDWNSSVDRYPRVKWMYDLCVSRRVHAVGYLVDVDPDFLYLCGHCLNVAVVYLNDIPVNGLAPYACYECFYPLCPYPLLRSYARFCQTHAKENAAILKDYNALYILFSFDGHLLSALCFDFRYLLCRCAHSALSAPSLSLPQKP